jgi:aryl-alcohol dehydrogenase-like predicted oxidoreductase
MKVNKIVLGTANFGSFVPKNEALSIIDYAYSLGINQIDTADSYAGSEEIIGASISGRRDKFFIATKVGNPTKLGSGLSASHIRNSLKSSLDKLRTEYIDLCFAHNFDLKIPLIETISTFNSVKKEGIINHFGCSNFDLNQLIESINTSVKNNLTYYTYIQSVFNIIEYNSQLNLLNFSNQNKIMSWGYSPLAGGVLTGKYLNGISQNSRAFNFPNADPRRTGFIPKINTINNEIAKNILNIAKNYNLSSAQLILGWVLNQTIITSVIIGVRNLEHLKNLLGSDVHPEAICAMNKLTNFSIEAQI